MSSLIKKTIKLVSIFLFYGSTYLYIEYSIQKLIYINKFWSRIIIQNYIIDDLWIYYT